MICQIENAIRTWLWIPALSSLFVCCSGMKSSATVQALEKSDYTLTITQLDIPGGYSRVMEAVGQHGGHINCQFVNRNQFFADAWIWQIDYYAIEENKINKISADLRQCPGILGIEKIKSARI